MAVQMRHFKFVSVFATLSRSSTAWSEEMHCLTSGECESDAVQLLQKRQPKKVERLVPTVQCTYGLTPDDRCAGNQCCPGAEETGWKTYPCPNALPNFTDCEGPKPISCGKLTPFGQTICEQDEHCKWQVWKKQVEPYPPRNRTQHEWSESCTFSKKYSETCYPPPGARFNSSWNPMTVPKSDWWQYQVPCDQEYKVWPAGYTLQTNSGWPTLGMDWNNAKSWGELDAMETEAASSLGWAEATWQTLTVLSRGDPASVATFPESAFKYWANLTKDEQKWAETLGWEERLWNWNALSMKGAHMFGSNWVPAIYVQYSQLNDDEKDGVAGLGWFGQSNFNKVYWEDPGYGTGIKGQSWPSSQCQDWDNVNRTAANLVMERATEVPHDYLWKIYVQMFAPICPQDNPPNMTSA